MKIAPRDVAGITIGLDLVVSIVATTAIGSWADRRLGTAPWLLVVGFLLGTAAGFRSLFRAAKKLGNGATDGPRKEPEARSPAPRSGDDP